MTLAQKSKELIDSMGQIKVKSLDTLLELSQMYPNGFSMYIPTITLDEYVNSSHHFTDDDGEQFVLIGLAPSAPKLIVSYLNQSNKAITIESKDVSDLSLTLVVHALCEFITAKETEINENS